MSFISNLFKLGSPAKITKSEETPGSSKCPYCEMELLPRPSQKKKCPYCGQQIIVRTHYKTKNKILLTVTQATQFDIEKEKYYALTSFLRGLADCGIERSSIDNLVIKETRILTEKFGKEPSFADVVWGVSNQLIIKHPNLSQGIHFQQAIFVHSEGKDPAKLLLIDLRNSLKEYQKSEVVKSIEIITAGEESCKYCRKLENKVFSIQEALNNDVLPCKECSFDKNAGGFGWCRCCYVPKDISID